MSPDRELSSWKEIAAHLGVSIRTAQGWEQERGLPVRRIPGGHGRVCVTASELDEWKRSGEQRKAPLPEAAQPRRRIRYSGRLLAAGLVAVAVAGGALLPGLFRGRPASYRAQGNTFIVLDERGNELWRKVFPYALHPDLQAGTATQCVWFGDLDRHPSVLFVPASAAALRESTPLICYTDRGKERWRFTPGRRVHTSTEDFDPIYGGPNFLVGPVGKGGRTAIVAVSSHYLFYPTQVTLLSTGGKMLREYWHSGHLPLMRLEDLNGDGESEIYLAGINNGAKAATIVVLDPESFEGASLEPEAPDHQLVGFAPGRERKRILLPRSCLSRTFDPYNTITRFWISEGTITVETNEFIESPAGIYYHFDPDLRAYRAELGDAYRVRYAHLKAAGQLARSCTLGQPLGQPTVLPTMQGAATLTRVRPRRHSPVR